VPVAAGYQNGIHSLGLYRDHAVPPPSHRPLRTGRPLCQSSYHWDRLQSLHHCCRRESTYRGQPAAPVHPGARWTSATDMHAAEYRRAGQRPRSPVRLSDSSSCPSHAQRMRRGTERFQTRSTDEFTWQAEDTPADGEPLP